MCALSHRVDGTTSPRCSEGVRSNAGFHTDSIFLFEMTPSLVFESLLPTFHRIFDLHLFSAYLSHQIFGITY